MEAGVGGGVFYKFAEKLFGKAPFETYLEKSNQGNIRNVDLQIEDVSTQEIPNLPKDITSSNFGKLNEQANSFDILLGIANLVFETVGVMSAFLCKNDNTKDIVIIGSMAKHPYIKEVIKKLEKLHNVNYIVPENPEFICALGAIENYKSKNKLY